MLDVRTQMDATECWQRQEGMWKLNAADATAEQFSIMKQIHRHFYQKAKRITDSVPKSTD